MSDETQAKLPEFPLSEEDRQLRVLAFQMELIICEERNEFVASYLAVLTAKLAQMKSIHGGAALSPTLLLGWQCAAFLMACGKSNLPIADGVQTLREFVSFLDDGLVHWR